MNEITTAIIPVAGLATRIGSSSQYVAKCMLPAFDGVSLLEHALNECLSNGIKKILVLLPQKEIINKPIERLLRDFKNKHETQIDISGLIVEPKGLSYAIKQALDYYRPTDVHGNIAGAFVILPDDFVSYSSTLNLVDELRRTANSCGSDSAVLMKPNEPGAEVKFATANFGILKRDYPSSNSGVLVEKPGCNPNLFVYESVLSVVGRYLVGPELVKRLMNCNETPADLTEYLNVCGFQAYTNNLLTIEDTGTLAGYAKHLSKSRQST